MKDLKFKILLILSTFFSSIIFSQSTTEEKNNQKEKCCSVNNRQNIKNNKCKPICSNSCYSCGITTFIPRSQGANTARELISWENLLHRNYDVSYAVLDAAIEVTRSFKDCRLANLLFCTNCLTFSGSQVPDRNNQSDVVADYFGLATDFKTTLKIEPVIENHIVDLNGYFGLNGWCPGLYMRVHVPITHTKWNLGLDECFVCDNKELGSRFFPSGYMLSTKDSASSSNDFQDNASAIGYDAETTNSIREALSGNYLFGDMQTFWNYGRFSFCPKSQIGVADIDVIWGIDIIQNGYSNIGIYGQLVIPTGNRPKAKFIFEPIVGNGKHWELGLGFSGHVTISDSSIPRDFNLGLYIEGNATHMFKTDQIRSFDLKNGQLSRYLLLKEFDKDLNYTGNLINAINFTTRNCEVTIDYKVDFSAKLEMSICSWIMDFGYNIYTRDREKIRIETECPCDLDYRKFGIKGTEGVACLNYTLNNTKTKYDFNDTVTKLNTTQENATIFNAQSPAGTMTTTEATETAGMNTVCLNYNTPNLKEELPINDQTNIVLAQNNIPTIITCKDLDPNSAAQCKALTHKFFTTIGYDWTCHCYEPHISIGGEVEFDGEKIHNSLNQWGIWIKGGISF